MFVLYFVYSQTKMAKFRKSYILYENMSTFSCFLYQLVGIIGPILDDRLKEKLLKP